MLDKDEVTILMAEDDQLIRKLNVEILSRLGYRVIDAMDGIDALEKFESMEDSVDLLMTDIMMPGMDGARLADRIRERKPDMKVLYNSGYCDDDTFESLPIDEQTATFLPKPYLPGTLAEKIKDILER